MSAGRLQGSAAGTGGDSVRPAAGMGADTKPTLPVTPPAGFKLMQDPFTGQLFIIPGQLCKKKSCIVWRDIVMRQREGVLPVNPHSLPLNIR